MDLVLADADPVDLPADANADTLVSPQIELGALDGRVELDRTGDTHARSSNQLGATRNHYKTEVAPRIRTIEPLWRPLVAAGGNQWQIGRAPKPRKQAKSVAIGCHRLPETFDGKEERCVPSHR